VLQLRSVPRVTVGWFIAWTFVAMPHSGCLLPGCGSFTLFRCFVDLLLFTLALLLRCLFAFPFVTLLRSILFLIDSFGCCTLPVRCVTLFDYVCTIYGCVRLLVRLFLPLLPFTVYVCYCSVVVVRLRCGYITLHYPRFTVARFVLRL